MATSCTSRGQTSCWISKVLCPVYWMCGLIRSNHSYINTLAYSIWSSYISFYGTDRSNNGFQWLNPNDLTKDNNRFSFSESLENHIDTDNKWLLKTKIIKECVHMHKDRDSDEAACLGFFAHLCKAQLDIQDPKNGFWYCANRSMSGKTDYRALHCICSLALNSFSAYATWECTILRPKPLMDTDFICVAAATSA